MVAHRGTVGDTRVLRKRELQAKQSLRGEIENEERQN